MAEFIGSLSVDLRMNIWSLCSIVLLAHAQTVSAIQIYTPDTLPTDLSPSCADALTLDVAACPLLATKLRYGFFYPESKLESTCTAECSTALQTYEQGVVSSCSNDTWLAYEDDEENLPVAFIPNVMRYLYELTCIQDDGRFCNVVAGMNAAMADPGGEYSSYWTQVLFDARIIIRTLLGQLATRVGWAASQTGQVRRNATYALSRACGCKLDRRTTTAPKSQASQFTSLRLLVAVLPTCREQHGPCQRLCMWDQPRDSQVFGIMINTMTPLLTWCRSDLPQQTPPACAGKTYQIQPGDDCHSISTSQGIATSWLLSDNNLASFCTDFPTEGSLCLTNTCSVYTVQTNDTCKSVAKTSNITEALLISWNPVSLPALACDIRKSLIMLVGTQLGMWQHRPLCRRSAVYQRPGHTVPGPVIDGARANNRVHPCSHSHRRRPGRQREMRALLHSDAR